MFLQLLTLFMFSVFLYVFKNKSRSSFIKKNHELIEHNCISLKNEYTVLNFNIKNLNKEFYRRDLINFLIKTGKY